MSMKKSLLIGLAILCVSAAGIAGWYAIHTRQIEAELAQYKQWADARKLVKVEFVVDAPKDTPPDQSLWISGDAADLGGWDGAGVQLAKTPDGKHHGQIEVMSGIEYAFKVTRGSWSTVERGPKGEETPNHTLKVDADTNVPITVATWVDGGKSMPGLHTLSGLVREHRKFHSAALGNDRTIVVYLPPGYDESPDRRYPVLYMQDGQNLFDAATSFAGIEWKVDEAAQKLISENKIEPVIIVGIYNSEQRTPEFTPPGPSSSAAAQADVYAKFVVEQVKPFIDQTYRTKPDRASTSLAGSSMGGLISLYTLKSHPQTFGQLAILTPHLRTTDRDILAEWSKEDLAWLRNTRIWLDMGDKGGDNYPGKSPIDDARNLVKLFESAGLKKDIDFKYTEIPGGEHNEPAWQGRVDQVLMFLYAPRGG
jgi:predicted alpha/beta superfamily hydrolase